MYNRGKLISASFIIAAILFRPVLATNKKEKKKKEKKKHAHAEHNGTKCPWNFTAHRTVVKRRTCSRTCPKIRIYISTTPASRKIEFPSADRFCESFARFDIRWRVRAPPPSSSPSQLLHPPIIIHARVTQLGDVQLADIW